MKKYILGITAFLMVVLASAFTLFEKKVSTPTIYEFQGTDLSEVKDIANWGEVSTAPGNCLGPTLPCYVTINGGQSEMQDFLDARTEEQIRDQADATRD